MWGVGGQSDNYAPLSAQDKQRSAHIEKREEIEAPVVTSIMSFMTFTIIFIIGKLRDVLGGHRRRTVKKGYAPLREPQEDFYQRRMFSRLKDCWNRPIASAPDAWIDVMERTDITHTSGKQPMKLLGTQKRCLNLGSYNYLGFAASDPYCTPQVQDLMLARGVSTCSARADAGTTPEHLQLEKMVAEFIGVEDALTFGMGYATNSATIPVLAGKGCLLISDALNHASIVSGARASGAKVKVFRHNDAGHLEAVLRNSIAEGQPRTHRPWKKVLIIVEGIYSMEGEVCALRDIVAVKKKYGAYLYLDEAHSIGALGPRGRGVCEHWGVDPREIDIMMGTFTKSFGSCGGYIAGSKVLIDYLRRHNPAHLYATSMSAPSCQQVIAAINLLNGEDGTTRGLDKVRKLHDNANYFRRKMLDMGLHVLGDWDSPVMPVMIYQPGKVPAVSRLCLERNIATVVVGFPATALLLTRARVCISAAHTQSDLEYALEVLDEVTDICMLKYGRHAKLAPLRVHPTNASSVPPEGALSVGQRYIGATPAVPFALNLAAVERGLANGVTGAVIVSTPSKGAPPSTQGIDSQPGSPIAAQGEEGGLLGLPNGETGNGSASVKRKKKGKAGQAGAGKGAVEEGQQQQPEGAEGVGFLSDAGMDVGDGVAFATVTRTPGGRLRSKQVDATAQPVSVSQKQQGEAGMEGVGRARRGGAGKAKETRSAVELEAVVAHSVTGRSARRSAVVAA